MPMNENREVLNSLLAKTRALGADMADGICVESADFMASRRLGRPEDLERSESRAIGLRAFCGNRQAMVSSTDLSRDTLHELAERAVAMARVAPPDADSDLAKPSWLAKDSPALDLLDEDEPAAGWFDAQCKAAEDAALAVQGISNSEGAQAHYGRHKVWLAASSAGVEFSKGYETSMFSLSVSVLAGEGTGMERDYAFCSRRHRADVTDAESIGREAAARALARLNPRKVKTCIGPVVFDPRVSKSLVGIFASSISGSAVARGTSFLKDKMGAGIFNPAVTIVDDPHIVRGMASKPFDAEGVQNRKRTLVENGTLTSWILDIRTANKLGLVTTGHATRGAGSAPSPAATNIYMQNGAQSPETLMRDIKSGFYVTEAFGMGVNTVTGDYSQGASGFWIENGEIAYPVSEITIAGRLADMFARCTPANDLAFEYSANAPTVRIDDMTIAGI